MEEAIAAVRDRVERLESRLSMVALEGEKPHFALRLAPLKDVIEKEYGRTITAVERKLRQLEAFAVIRLGAVELTSERSAVAARIEQLKADPTAQGEEAPPTPIEYEPVDGMLLQQRIWAILSAPSTLAENFSRDTDFVVNEYAPRVLGGGGAAHAALAGGAATKVDAIGELLTTSSDMKETVSLQLKNADRLAALHGRLERVARDYKSLATLAETQLRSWDLQLQLKESSR